MEVSRKGFGVYKWRDNASTGLSPPLMPSPMPWVSHRAEPGGMNLSVDSKVPQKVDITHGGLWGLSMGQFSQVAINPMSCGGGQSHTRMGDHSRVSCVSPGALLRPSPPGFAHPLDSFISSLPSSLLVNQGPEHHNGDDLSIPALLYNTAHYRRCICVIFCIAT